MKARVYLPALLLVQSVGLPVPPARQEIILMSFRFIGPVLWAGLLLATVSTQAQAQTVATCSPTKMRIKVAATTASTTSTSFVAIPDSGLTFTQGGTGPSCVLVRFSAASSVNGNSVARVAAKLDNATSAEPVSAQFSGDTVSGGSRAHSFEFLFVNVPPGPHTVRMMYMVGNGSDEVFMDERTMVVQHAP
jgi:hypothetical protein